jgi:hypothetical protein
MYHQHTNTTLLRGHISRPFSPNSRKVIAATAIHYITAHMGLCSNQVPQYWKHSYHTWVSSDKGEYAKKKTSLGIGFFECQITAVPFIFPHLARPANEHCTFHHPGGAIDVRRGDEARGRLATRLGLLQPVSVVVVRVFTAVADWLVFVVQGGCVVPSCWSLVPS